MEVPILCLWAWGFPILLSTSSPLAGLGLFSFGFEKGKRYLTPTPHRQDPRPSGCVRILVLQNCILQIAAFSSECKRHINFLHINFPCRPSSPGLSQGQTHRDKPGFAGLPLCKIRRKPGFVPGLHRVCPRDKPGEIPRTNPGLSQDQPDKKVYVYVPFSCLIFNL